MSKREKQARGEVPINYVELPEGGGGDPAAVVLDKSDQDATQRAEALNSMGISATTEEEKKVAVESMNAQWVKSAITSQDLDEILRLLPGSQAALTSWQRYGTDIWPVLEEIRVKILALKEKATFDRFEVTTGGGGGPNVSCTKE